MSASCSAPVSLALYFHPVYSFTTLFKFSSPILATHPPHRESRVRPSGCPHRPRRIEKRGADALCPYFVAVQMCLFIPTVIHRLYCESEVRQIAFSHVSDSMSRALSPPQG